MCSARGLLRDVIFFRPSGTCSVSLCIKKRDLRSAGEPVLSVPVLEMLSCSDVFSRLVHLESRLLETRS